MAVQMANLVGEFQHTVGFECQFGGFPRGICSKSLVRKSPIRVHKALHQICGRCIGAQPATKEADSVALLGGHVVIGQIVLHGKMPNITNTSEQQAPSPPS